MLPASVAESRITKYNSSAHVPTVFVTTHRRMSHHYHTEAEQGVHPPRRQTGSAAGAPSVSGSVAGATKSIA